MLAVNESPAQSEPSSQPAVRVRYRIRFAKTGLLRWISHRDLARLWERLVRRAELPLSMTEGFHPKPRIAFPSALALGVESWDEVVELELAEELTPHGLLQRLRADRQPGLTIHSVKRLPEGFGKGQLQRSDYLIELPEVYEPAAARAAIERLLSTETVSLERKKKTVTVHVPSQIESLELHGRQLQLSLAASDAASLRPGDVLDLLELNDWAGHGTTIRRAKVVLQREFETDNPQQCARAPREEASAPDAAAGESLRGDGEPASPTQHAGENARQERSS